MRIRFQKSWVLLAVALGLGGLSAFGVKRYIEQHVAEVEERSKAQSTVKVLVPKGDLVKGAVLTAELVAVREVPSMWAHSNALTPAQFDRIEGQALAYPAVRGEMLLWSMLEGQRPPAFSTRLPNGRRAITVPVDEVNSISGLLQPGDRIDLMVAAKKDSKSYLFPLLQNVTVLATGSQAVVSPDGKEGSKNIFSTITLDAAPEDARRVLAAREIGKLAAMLRSPGDNGVLASTQQDALSLLGLGGDNTSSGSSVPVLYGGRNSNAQTAETLRALNALSPGKPEAGGKP